MFISRKTHEREKQELISAGNRLTDAILKGSVHGLFVLDAKDKILPQVSASLSLLFRRQDFTHLTFEKLLGPVVTAKTLSAVRPFVTRLRGGAAPSDDNPLQDVEVRLANADGSIETAHYSFEFNAVESPGEPRAWLVTVTDLTARVQQNRELEDFRTQLQTQGEILRSVLQAGAAPFNAFLHRTDAAMNAINAVLKKPAREADAFRNKLEETLDEVDRVRRDAAGFKLTGLENAARLMEDSLHELRSRGALSGSDFLPLAVKLDQLYGQFAQLRLLTSQASTAAEPEVAAPDARVTENGTQIIEAPKFLAEMAQQSAPPKAHRMVQAGSLDSTLTALTELMAQEHDKSVVLECIGMQLVPSRYQAAIKNVAIQLIRNAVMHGVETPAARQAAGKPAHGTLLLEFSVMPDQSFEMRFQDDGCGLDPDKVRAAAIARGLITEDDATQLRDRQAIKLIFTAGFTTLPQAPGETAHGFGMSLVRRYVHDAGGRISLATQQGRETRFKVTLPALAAAAAHVA